MSIVRYTPLNDFAPTSFSTLIDRFFNDTVSRSGGSVYGFVPRVDVVEDEKAFEIHLAVPGMSKDDFKIELNENELTISGERKFSKERKESNFRSIETQYGKFSRTFTVPENVDGSKIQAQYENGLLVLTLPKDEKKAVRQSIKVG
jgi:HSP20 family protein